MRTRTSRGSRAKKAIALAGGAVVVVIVVLATLGYYGVIWPNRIPAGQYEIRGVDVSYAQGSIDWPVLASNDIDFAFMKATEGSGHTDKWFAGNWSEASKTKLLIGAYHFFSFESPGETQAGNFIKSVPVMAGSLPPVITRLATVSMDIRARRPLLT